MNPKPEVSLGVRWTVGDVSAQGFEALRLSVWSAWRMFGPDTLYTICVNTIATETAAERTGDLPPTVSWRAVTQDDIPAFLCPHLDRAMAEGVAWKFSPLRVFPERYELALDNDCILWDWPVAIRTWLEGWHSQACVFAEDTARGLGQFSDLCGPEPRNSGIRGLPPGFDYRSALQAVLALRPVVMRSELDEQGLQAAALERAGPLLVVRVPEVTICSPFPTHRPELGTCGAHFVGLNSHGLPWNYYGQPASLHIAAHWQTHRNFLYRHAGLPLPETSGPASDLSEIIRMADT